MQQHGRRVLRPLTELKCSSSSSSSSSRAVVGVVWMCSQSLQSEQEEADEGWEPGVRLGASTVIKFHTH